ncbi:MAG: putative Ig domain-containing protein [Chloroflexota bacterium]|nr:putative Ig domain-containing protein [Chloroflexota bacterium]
MIAVSGGATFAQTGDVAQTGPVFTVNTTAHPGDGECTTANCTLMEAITVANTTPNGAQPDQVHFNIAGCPNGICSIVSPDTFVITDPVVVDGLTQPGLNGTCPLAAQQPLRIQIRDAIDSGIRIAAPNVTVRGLVISSSVNNGIDAFDTLALQDTTIECNYIGTDPTGLMNLGTRNHGIYLRGAPRSRIVSNLLSGNVQYGVALLEASDSLVQGNRTGTDITGTAAIPNVAGIGISDSNNVRVVENLSSGNAVTGIFLNTTNSVVAGNFIGVATDGVTPLGNGVTGIWVRYTGGNLIGGDVPQDRNIIRHHTGQGIQITDGAAGIRIVGNSISDNGGLGIDLRVRVEDPAGIINPNDDDNVDPGEMGNRGQNYPVITSATTSQIDFSLNSRSNRSYRIEFFANTACDASGYGEGEVYLGATTVDTDSTGFVIATFVYTPIIGKPILTATATDSEGNTSEFSQCSTPTIGTLTPATPTATATSTPTSTPTTPYLVPDTLPNAQVDVTYSQQLSVMPPPFGGGGGGGGNDKVSVPTFSIAIGQLPPGITLSTSGLLSGVPTTLGSYEFTVQVTGSVNASRSYTLVVQADPVPTWTPNPATLTAMPSLTPTATATPTATSTALPSPSVTPTVTPIPLPLALTTLSLPNGAVGMTYSQTIDAMGGRPPYTFSVQRGVLPLGLSLSMTGVLSGIPTQHGGAMFTLQVVDAAGTVASQMYSLVINPSTIPSLTLTPSSLPIAYVNTGYQAVIGAQGGNGAYTYLITGGMLPPGMMMDGATGVISGMPTTEGSYTFTVQAFDSAGATGTATFVLTVAPPDTLSGN